MTTPPDNAMGRRMHDLLLRLGYRLAGRGGGGHFRYEQDGYDNVYVSGSAYDGSSWGEFRSDMRRRHPAHPALVVTKAPPDVRRARRERARRARARANQRPAVAVADRPPAAPSPPPDRTSCEDCGRPWLSDLDPIAYPCPACGGAHRLGRDE